jgi:NADPH:quinone reductase-like Zn-dependent oxidoreductase
MKAIVRPKYGSPDVLQLKEMEKPALADDRVLVRVHAASLNKADLYDLGASPLIRLFGGGFWKPKSEMIGSDIAGRVEAVGKDVKQFRVGDEVFGGGAWGLAEYAPAREDRIAIKPSNATFEEAAAVPIAAITALQALRDKGNVQAGQKVLIYGASGGVGTFAVQIAKAFGAEVTAVCSTANAESALSMGADHVIDYTKEDFAKSGVKYDLILAINGGRSILTHRRILSKNGIFVLIGGSNPIGQILQVFLVGKPISKLGGGGKKMEFMIAKLNQKDLVFLKELLEAGKIKSVIDGRFKLSETAEAFRYLGEGHARAKIVATIQ